MQTIALRLFGNEMEARDYLPLLKWLIIAVLGVFGFGVAWRLGLVDLLLRTHTTLLPLLVLGLFLAATAHCFVNIVAVSREINAGHRVRDRLENGATGFRVAGRDVLTTGGPLVPGLVTEHIRNLIIKGRSQEAATDPSAKLDQTNMLRALADRLRARSKLGWFVADGVLKLGLLGTIIGFMLMLGPLTNLETFDVVAMRAAMSAMSSGMATALGASLAGLICAILLRVQYYILDDATAYLLNLVTQSTEVYVIPALQQAGYGKL